MFTTSVWHLCGPHGWWDRGREAVSLHESIQGHEMLSRQMTQGEGGLGFVFSATGACEIGLVLRVI